MSAGHSHAIPATGNERSLWMALGLTSIFLIAEVIAGFMFRSLALLTDAAHMFTDAAALAIAVAAVRIARRPADAKRTYGYHRFEILAAARSMRCCCSAWRTPTGGRVQQLLVILALIAELEGRIAASFRV